MNYTKSKWYVTTTTNIADQGFIGDEVTGEAIAVAYKMENAALIAAAPEILSALKEAEAYFRELENTKNMIGPEYGIWHRIQARIELAEGRL